MCVCVLGGGGGCMCVLMHMLAGEQIYCILQIHVSLLLVNLRDLAKEYEQRPKLQR